MATDAKAKSGSGSLVALRERYEIDPTKPLPELDMPQAKAYACVDSRGKGRGVYALVCRHDLPARTGAMRALKGVQMAGMLHLLEYGAVHWPPSERRAMVVVYEKPKGGKVLSQPDGRFPVIPEIQFAKKAINPLLQALTEISQRGVTHRSIRLDNLYWMDGAKEKLVLGDCVTAPPGYDNGALYEPLELGLATPEGRGQGHVKDDLYSLGMVAVGLLSGRDFPRDKTDQQILEDKLAHSTYSLYATNSRVPLNMLDMTRGLLCDDIRDRWGIDQIDMWINGRRSSPVQPKPAKRSQRALRFEGADYFSAAELAHAFSLHWEAATAPVMDGRLETWLRRGLEEGQMADQVLTAIRMAQGIEGDAKQVGDFALARVLMLLDPKAPLRYREVRVTLDGFGAALARAALKKNPLKPFVEIIARDLPKHWIDAQGGQTTQLNHFEMQFKDLSANLTTQTMGYGIERCLYELNEDLHCQSPLIEHEHVTDIRELLPALDRVAPSQENDRLPMDRHIAAFIGVKWKRDTKVQFRAMAEPDELRATLGMISLLAVLQWRLGPPTLHGLCGWIGGQLTPVINSYNSRLRRKELETDIPKLVRKGSLPDLYNVLDNQEERAKDEGEFAWARAEYRAGRQQLAAIEQGQSQVDDRAILHGQQAAATLSVLIAIVTVCGVLFYRMW